MAKLLKPREQVKKMLAECIRAGEDVDAKAAIEPCAATIHGWVKQADRDGGRRADGLTGEERDELRRLRH